MDCGTGRNFLTIIIGGQLLKQRGRRGGNRGHFGVMHGGEATIVEIASLQMPLIALEDIGIA
ncbi:MAG TPA: hypothetical protein DIT28_14640 [Oxalobacteraceae bacterium]|nr:hypothetical protein [Oxalobacteraceae bacterium]HCN90392.1 hypothetical protein [Oxalobacteraceae bacterium]